MRPTPCSMQSLISCRLERLNPAPQHFRKKNQLLGFCLEHELVVLPEVWAEKPRLFQSLARDCRSAMLITGGTLEGSTPVPSPSLTAIQGRGLERLPAAPDGLVHEVPVTPHRLITVQQRTPVPGHRRCAGTPRHAPSADAAAAEINRTKAGTHMRSHATCNHNQSHNNNTVPGHRGKNLTINNDRPPTTVSSPLPSWTLEQERKRQPYTMRLENYSWHSQDPMKSNTAKPLSNIWESGVYLFTKKPKPPCL